MTTFLFSNQDNKSDEEIFRDDFKKMGFNDDIINFIILLHQEHYKNRESDLESDLFDLCGMPHEDICNRMNELQKSLDNFKKLICKNRE